MRLHSVFATGLLASLFLAGPLAQLAWADGGTLQLSQRQGDIQIAVFTAPSPLRVGPVDVSVLWLDDATDRPSADAAVSVELTLRSDPSVRLRALATQEAATNKLLRSALIDLPVAGQWDLEIVCTTAASDTRVSCPLEVAPPRPRWLTQWPLLAWPAGVVLLFAAHRWLVERREQAAIL